MFRLFILILVLYASMGRANGWIGYGTDTTVVEQNGFKYKILSKVQQLQIQDLLNHGDLEHVNLYLQPDHLLIHANKAYILSRAHDALIIVDLRLKRLDATFYVGDFPLGMVIYNQMAVVLSGHSKRLTFIDLKRAQIIHKLDLPHEPWGMLRQGRNLYILSRSEGILTVCDLNTQTLTKQIPVGKKPVHLLEVEHRLFVMNNQSHTLTIVDMDTLEIIKELNVGDGPLRGRYVEGYVIIEHEDRTMTFINAKKMVIELKLPFRDVHIDGAKLYIKGVRVIYTPNS